MDADFIFTNFILLKENHTQKSQRFKQKIWSMYTFQFLFIDDKICQHGWLVDTSSKSNTSMFWIKNGMQSSFGSTFFHEDNV